jgi:beta-glucosidase
VKELIGFRRVSLAPDEAARVTFTVAMNQLGFYNENMEFVVEPGSIDILIGSSSADIRLTGSLAVTGPTVKLGSRGFLSSSTIAPPRLRRGKRSTEREN